MADLCSSLTKRSHLPDATARLNGNVVRFAGHKVLQPDDVVVSLHRTQMKVLGDRYSAKAERK
jgi:hypothetical protein